MFSPKMTGLFVLDSHRKPILQSRHVEYNLSYVLNSSVPYKNINNLLKKELNILLYFNVTSTYFLLLLTQNDLNKTNENELKHGHCSLKYKIKTVVKQR